MPTAEIKGVMKLRQSISHLVDSMIGLCRGWIWAFLPAAVVAAGMSLRCAADVVAGAENWTIEAGAIPHVVCNVERGVDFAVDKYGSNGWKVVVHHTQGWGYVEIGTVGAAVDSAMFQGDLHEVEGTGGVFRFAFYWWPPEDGENAVRHYGWVALGTRNGELAILAAEIANAPGTAVVGRGEPDLPVAPSGPDDIEMLSEKTNDVIRQLDFTAKYDCGSIYLVPGIEGYFVRGGDVRDETRTNFNGRSCARLSACRQCMTSWFSINKMGCTVKQMASGAEIRIEYVGECHNPALYDAIGVALRLWADVPCTAAQAPHTEFPVGMVDWWSELFEYSETLPEMPEAPGAVIHVDDKMWLRYLASEDGGTCKTNWQACVGMMDASSDIVERTVDLKAADESASLPSPVGAWTTIRVEAENTASPNGLGFRIWIGGVAAASADGATVFYARPSATDRTGVAALGIGGNAFIDDLTFFEKHRNPLDGVEVNTRQEALSEDKLKSLAAILGEETVSGVTSIDAQDWDCSSDERAAHNCISLGITPAETDLKCDCGQLTLKFRNPTVEITAVDFAARTITAKVIPAEGTRIAIPPMPYMFGLTQVRGLGTNCADTSEYGDCFSQGQEGFSVDLSNYVTAKGEFTLHFPEWLVSDCEPIFFSRCRSRNTPTSENAAGAESRRGTS